eukprot:CAMPEP_0202051218 /NCGR_PEP_ID=MMETSP0963-20130614/4489_1 /ASSEMBLY_ACC=CAM_ASM_000494 /TAXON_ID=4773 /ORGANISM="Schizochytrium aggregatum, Strain ATCC28209" /LENGTH=403 /DNA_ID=CAMNT_0048616371 /DNA_START=79 /DNA_END=1290 /DNA_ORIENTATION=+
MASVVRTQTYAVGAEVEAKAKGWKQFYKGRVTAFDEASGTYSVEFEDGDKQTGIKGFNVRAAAKKETFTAPDGKTFDTKQAFRKYMSETFYSFRDQSGQTLIKKEGDIAGQTFSICNLQSCEVQILDHSDQVLVDGITDCTVIIGPSSESVFVRKAKNCKFFIACKQFRSRDCENCLVSLYSKTEPVVETSTGMRFFPYSASYPNQTAHFAMAKLQPEHNHWCNVFDFNKGDASIPEPHWELVPEAEGWPLWTTGEEAENPVPATARAHVVPKEQGFAIGTEQTDAQRAFDQQEEDQHQQVHQEAGSTTCASWPGQASATIAPPAPPAPAVEEADPATAADDSTSERPVEAQPAATAAAAAAAAAASPKAQNLSAKSEPATTITAEAEQVSQLADGVNAIATE